MTPDNAPDAQPLLIVKFIDDATGQMIEVQGDSFAPLDLATLVQALRSPGKPLTFPLQLTNATVRSDLPELAEDPTQTVRVRIDSPFTNDVIALVPGGWMTAAMCPPDALLMVDQNVFSIFDRHLRSDRNPALPPDFLMLLRERESSFSPILYMMEGQLGRPSETVEELEASYDRFASRIATHFPKAKTVPPREQSAPGALSLLKQRKERYVRECAFLVEVAPLLIPETGRAKRDQVWDQLEASAARHGVPRMSYVFMAVLCATSTSPEFNAGRMILKPRPGFDRGDAHNAVSDLIALELMNNVIAAFPGKWPVFLTHDRGLALLWNGARTHSHVRGPSHTRFRVTFLRPLFDRLTPEQDARLVAMIADAGD